MSRLFLALLLVLALAGCNTSQFTQDKPIHTEDGNAHDQHDGIYLEDDQAVTAFFKNGRATLQQAEPFEQLGLMLNSRSTPEVAYRLRGGAWQQAEITWSEAPLYNARIILEEPAKVLELRVSNVQTLSLEFFEHAVKTPARLARNMPFEKAPLEPQVAPDNLVVSRYQWGARNPGKVCGNPHTPYRMTIHHTAGNNGRTDPAAVMRAIQAYHIDTNGWCDIGYHFIVSYDGTVFQGLSNEARTGTHVYQQNTGNIGISLMGHYETQSPPDSQINGAAKIVGWVNRSYRIALNRSNVKGHNEWPLNTGTLCPGERLLALIPTILSRAGGWTTPPPCSISWPIANKWTGDKERVMVVQYLLRSRGYSLTVDGSFGTITENAVKRFQYSVGLDPDGSVGPKTWPKLIRVVQYGSQGDAVRAVQLKLGLTVDGSFGSQTDRAVRAFQDRNGLEPDGVVGPNTWAALVGGKGCP